MRSTTPGRSARSAAGALLVLLAWGAVGPGEARAGCSRYAQAHDPASAVLATLDLARSPGEAPRPADRPRPCTGAMCSGQPAPASSTAPAPVRIGAWAILTPPPPPPAPRSSSLPRDERDIRALHPPGSVFHPPRPSVSSIAL